MTMNFEAYYVLIYLFFYRPDGTSGKTSTDPWLSPPLNRPPPRSR